MYDLKFFRLLMSDVVSKDGGTLKISYDDKQINDPYMTELSLESRSRRDISSDDFDQKKTLVLDIGAAIITLLSSDQEDLSLDHIAPGIEGTSIGIEPCLIQKGPVFKIQLLTDGKPKLTCRNTLKNVDIDEAGVNDRRTRYRWLRDGTYWVYLAITAIIALRAVSAEPAMPFSTFAIYVAIMFLTIPIQMIVNRKYPRWARRIRDRIRKRR